jgi:D-arabinose 1-dehydrogenase-like Zn-dependent alcohol dehydrogenase
MVANAESTMLLPVGLDYALAAPIFCAGYTVWSGLRWANPQPGEKIAIIGIGGLGHLAVQYAKAAGFYTIAVSRSKDKEKMIRGLGADEVVADGAALEAIGGADVILSTSNSSKSASEAVRGIRPDGRLVIMGLDTEPVQISPADLILKRIKIVGSQQNNREYLYEALDFVAKGKVKPMIEKFALKDIETAYDKVEKGDVRFRAVICMN